MRDERLIKELQQLKDITPSASWKQQAKEVLLMQVRNTRPQDSRGEGFFARFTHNLSTAKYMVGVLVPSFFTTRTLMRQTALALLVAALTFSGGFAGVKASIGSLPGDTLYSVKRAMEYTQISLAVSQEEKATLEVEFAGRRVEEVEEIAKLDVSQKEKSEKLAVATEGFTANVAAAASHLKNLTSEDALQTARQLDDKATSYEATLQDASKKVGGDAESKKTIGEAVDAASELSAEALGILVAEYYAGESDIPETDLKIRIAKRIVLMEERVKTLAEEQRQAKEAAKEAELRELQASTTPEVLEIDGGTDQVSATDTDRASSTDDVVQNMLREAEEAVIFGNETEENTAILEDSTLVGADGESSKEETIEAPVTVALEEVRVLTQESNFAGALEKLSESGVLLDKVVEDIEMTSTGTSAQEENTGGTVLGAKEEVATSTVESVELEKMPEENVVESTPMLTNN